MRLGYINEVDFGAPVEGDFLEIRTPFEVVGLLAVGRPRLFYKVEVILKTWPLY